MGRRNSAAVVLSIAILALTVAICVVGVSSRRGGSTPSGGTGSVVPIGLPPVVEDGVRYLMGIGLALFFAFIWISRREHAAAAERRARRFEAAEKLREAQDREALRRREDQLRDWLDERMHGSERRDPAGLRALLETARELAREERRP